MSPNPQWTAAAAEAGVRLDKFLASAGRLASRAKALAALERGKVYVNGVEMAARNAGRRIEAGDIIRVWMDRPGSSRRAPRTGPVGDLDIVHEDDDLVVVNKPPGILSIPLEDKRDVPSVQDELEQQFRSRGLRRPHVVHRIDQDTSGLVVYAKSREAQRALKSQFARRQPERVYLAVVYGIPEPPSGTWRDFLVWDEKAMIQKATSRNDPRAQEAISEYVVAEAFLGASLVEVRLVTGRRNQIRLQARLRGHTLIGEERYVYGPSELRPVRFGRQALHAWRLSFAHPRDARRVSFEARLPGDLQDLLVRLRR